MQLGYLENWKKNFYNSRFITFPLTDWIFSLFRLLMNIIKSIFGHPQIAGLTRLSYRIYNYRERGEHDIQVSSKGIIINGSLKQKLHYTVLKFLKEDGITIYEGSPKEIQKRLMDHIQADRPMLGRDFYRVTGMLYLLILVLSAVQFYLIFKVIHFFIYQDYLYMFMEIALTLANFFFTSNTILFFVGWHRYYYEQVTFTEALPQEEYELRTAEEQPCIVTVLPVYMEEPALVKRAVYSVCLQNYGNNSVFLLLGNEVNTKNNNVQENTFVIKEMVSDLRGEFLKERDIINEHFQQFLSISVWNHDEVCGQLLILYHICLHIMDWFEQKIREFSSSEEVYPTDDYFLTLNIGYHKNCYQQKADQCLRMHEAMKENGGDRDVLDDCTTFLMHGFTECTRVFAAEVEVFMRMEYANLEHQKTKAGNLTAFTNLLGKSWVEVTGETGERFLLQGEKGRYYPKPDYLCVFDADVAAKGNYLLRKVAYMEKHKGEKIGLIQSLYRISFPEFTNAASASGLATTWFLPQFMLYQNYDASYWQGFNGVMDYRAYESVGTFLAETFTEDTEFSLKLRANGYRIVSSSEYQCQTMSPEDLRSIRSQRVRWCSSGLTIAKGLFKMILQKKIVFQNIFEIYCNFAYILGLSNVAISIMIVWLIASPLSRQYFALEALPFFMYLLAFLLYFQPMMKVKGGLQIVVDGLAMNLYLNLTCIQGFFLGIGHLFLKKGNKTAVFKATARKNSRQRQFNYFEILALIGLTVGNGMQFYNAQGSGWIYQLFPAFQLLSVVLVVYKFRIRNKRRAVINRLRLEDQM